MKVYRKQIHKKSMYIVWYLNFIFVNITIRHYFALLITITGFLNTVLFNVLNCMLSSSLD